MEHLMQGQEARSHRTWNSKGGDVETALFISVQTVMMACIVLVAAQLLATL